MNSIVQSQVRAAQAEAERVFDDNPRVAFDDTKIRFGLEYEINARQEGAIVTLDLTDKSPVEGPRPKQQAAPTPKAPEIPTWGKVSGRET